MTYAILSAAAVVMSLALRTNVTHVRHRSTDGATPLDPTELGMLTSDGRVVLAAVGQLCGAGLVDASGPQRRLRNSDRDVLPTLARAIFDLYDKGSPKRTIVAIKRATPRARRDLRVQLIQRGYLGGPAFRYRVWLTGIPVDVLAAVGVVLASVRSDGRPLVLVTVAVLVIVRIASLRCPRVTARGRRTLRLTRLELSYLDPRKRPALESYGARHAGFAAALFGASAVWLLNPEFAASSRVNQFDLVAESSPGGGQYGGTCGTGCGCGGSGCGGGCGGGS